jgi:hypothetical protein
MKTPELFQAIQNTPLFTREGDPVNEITDPGDRQRLMLLVTRDGDVMTDLLADAVMTLMGHSGFQDAVTNAVVAYTEKDCLSLTTPTAGVGIAIVARAVELIDKHIDDNAADWLSILRHDRSLDVPARRVRL